MYMLHRKVPRKFEYPSQLIQVEKRDYVAIVTLNNPPLNTNTVQSMKDLLQTFRLLQFDPEVRAVILTGAGTRAFNAGSDISHLPAMTGNFREGKCNLEAELMATIEEISKPTICAIEGWCLGGGLEMACCCDIRIASSKTKLGVPEINLGLLPASGGMHRIPKLIGLSRALEMMYTGRQIPAEEAYQIGLINRVCEPGTVKENAFELAKLLATKPPKPLRMIKRFVNENAFRPNEDCFRKNMAYIDELYEDYNAMEGIKAFLEKRPPQFCYDEEEILADDN